MSESKFRQDAEAIFRAGLSAADPHRLLLEHSSIEEDHWSYRGEQGAVSWDLPAPGSERASPSGGGGVRPRPPWLSHSKKRSAIESTLEEAEESSSNTGTGFP